MEYTSQDMSNGTAVIIVDGNTVICNMFQDEDGDIGFYYSGKKYYFKDIKRK